MSSSRAKGLIYGVSHQQAARITYLAVKFRKRITQALFTFHKKCLNNHSVRETAATKTYSLFMNANYAL